MEHSMQYSLKHAYLVAKAHITAAGFNSEILWQKRRSESQISETELLGEAAWVILNGGMRERVVRGLFPDLSAAFLDWVSARTIISERRLCRMAALKTFNHPGKINAIISFTAEVAARGRDGVLEHVRRHGQKYVMSFPYLGPATSLHLMKNLGHHVAKPDRHLLRIASAARRKCPESLCREISESVGDPVSVVDLVLWRFATLKRDYISWFSDLRVVHAAA
jgi:hypothetical protein